MSTAVAIVRPTRLDDCVHLPVIEHSAAQLFKRDPVLAWLADGAVITADKHKELLASGICMIAEIPGDGRCGFITAQRFGADLHIWELSVVAAWQQRGIGRQLLDAAEQAGLVSGLQRATLTTFSDLAWNAPFYTRCGYVELSETGEEARLAGQLEAEAASGLPRARRCAMIKPL